MTFSGSRQPVYQRACRWLALTSAVALLASAALGLPAPARGQDEVGEIRRLVEAFVAALNSRDRRALAALFAVTPHRICNDLDSVVLNELSETEGTGGPTFARLAESRFSLTAGPVVVPLVGGRYGVTFGLDWSWRLQEESGVNTAAFVVQWRVQRLEGGWKVIDHRSREIGSSGAC